MYYDYFEVQNKLINTVGYLRLYKQLTGTLMIGSSLLCYGVRQRGRLDVPYSARRQTQGTGRRVRRPSLNKLYIYIYIYIYI